MRKFKIWLCRCFLPTWCREELLEENRRLMAALEQAQQENRELLARIAGMETVLRRLPNTIRFQFEGREEDAL